jgi:hypothetical protein
MTQNTKEDTRPRILINTWGLKTRFKKGHSVPVEWKENMGGKTRFKRGEVPWNAGKRNRCKCVDCGKELEPYIVKRCIICHRKFNKGKNHPWYGRKHSEQALEKNRLATKERWKNPKWRKKVLKARIGTQAGEKGSNWKGGISFEPYDVSWKNSLKNEVRKRDGYQCKICGVHQRKCIRKLDVHHIDCNKKNCNIENLVSLCRKCHLKLHHSPVKLLISRGR